MTMRRIAIDRTDPDMSLLAEAADILLSGGLVVFPTETVYGVGAAMDQPEALNRLFELKGRSSDKPLTLHLADIETFHRFAADTSAALEALLAEYWPGPLNVVVPIRSPLPLSSGRLWSEAGFRLPDCLIARKLASYTGGVILATSANKSGNPAPADADTVEKELGDAVELILDAGRCSGGTASTVVRIKGKKPEIIRAGAIPPEKLLHFF